MFEFNKFHKEGNLQYKILPTYYPDLMLTISTKRDLTDAEARQIETIFASDEFYVSDFTDNGIMFDFYATNEKDFQNHMDFLVTGIKQVAELPFSDAIEQITVE